MRLTDHHVAGTKRHLKPNTSQYYLAMQAEALQLGNTHMTYDKTWITERVRQDRSMDHGGVHRRATMAIRLNVTNVIMSGPKTAEELHPIYVTTWPDIEAPHTPFASLTK